MNFVRAAERLFLTALFGAALFGGTATAQPECSVLLRPSFGVHTGGNTVWFRDSSMTYGEAVLYSWNFGDGETSAQVSPMHSYDTAGSYTVSLTIYATSFPCANTFTRQVTIPMSTCGWAASFEHYGVSTNTSQFIDGSFVVEPAETLWEFGDGTSSTQPSHTWLLPGPHFVSLTRFNENCRVQTGHWVTVDGNVSTCDSSLFANFSAQQVDETSVLLAPELSTTAASPQLVIWTYGDGSMDTAQAVVHTYPGQGEYQVCMLVGAILKPTMDSCFAYVCHTILVGPMAGISEQSDDDGMHAWPVPFSTELNVSAPWLQGPCTVRLMNPAGQLVVDAQQTGNGTLRMDLGHLPAGAYVLEATTATGRGRTLLLKE